MATCRIWGLTKFPQTRSIGGTDTKKEESQMHKYLLIDDIVVDFSSVGIGIRPASPGTRP